MFHVSPNLPVSSWRTWLGGLGRPQLLDEEKVRGGKRLIAFNNMHPSSSKITTCQNETQIKVEVVVNWSHE